MEYPADLELDAPPEIARWRPFVQWLLAFPHLLIAGVLGQVAGVLAFVSWFIIVFTGRLPEAIANFQCLVIRYGARAYSYAGFLRESYPPFLFAMTPYDPGDDPVKVNFRPALEERNRLTVGLRFLWMIPIALFNAVVGIAAGFVVFAAIFAVLFTGRWPEGMRNFVVGAGRLATRVYAYGYLVVDEYPPFSLT